MGFFNFFSKEKKETLDKGLSKTKESVFSKIARAVAGKSKVDDEVLDNLEEVLITSDVGVETTLNIIKRIEERVAKDKYVNTQELNKILREEIAALLTENNTVDSDDFTVPEGKKPYVIMVVGKARPQDRRDDQPVVDRLHGRLAQRRLHDTGRVVERSRNLVGRHLADALHVAAETHRIPLDRLVADLGDEFVENGVLLRENVQCHIGSVLMVSRGSC